MSRLTGWWYSLRSFARRNDADRDMADEIAFHVDRQTRKHEAAGIPADEARQRALREFGGTTRWRQEARDARGSRLIDIIEQDLRHALRGLRRDPGFASMAILTLALAIGANAAMFGIIDRLLLRGPEQVVAPEQLVRIYVTNPKPDVRSRTSAHQSYALYLEARSHTSAFSATAIYRSSELHIGSGADSRVIPVTFATADFFALTGVRPAVGRFYSADEDRRPQGEQVVVLGYRYWQREFAGALSVVGKLVTLDDRTFRIVGVAPRGFTGVERAPVDAWIPMSTVSGDAKAEWYTSWKAGWGQVVGRLVESRAAANAQLTAVVRQTGAQDDVSLRQASVSVRPISYNVDGVEPPEYGVARLVAGVALVMLLVAAANTMNLILARAVRRQRELGVRVALGAGRWRVVRLMVVESLTIAMLGGLLGLVLARWGGVMIRRTLLPAVAWTDMPVDGRVLLWTAVVAVGTGIVVGLIPALQASRGDVASALRGGRTGSVGGSHAATRTSLQVAQLALSVVLLFSAGLFVRSLRNIRRVDLGFDHDRVLVVDVSFPEANPRTPDERARNAVDGRARFTDLRARLERVAGVASASVATGTPLFSIYTIPIRVPGLDSVPTGKGGGPFVSNVTPEYFKTMGTRILRGRGFAPNEGAGTEPVVIVNRTMAETLWPRADAIGHCIVTVFVNDDACARVVGVAADVHQAQLKEDVAMYYYVPYGQSPGGVRGSMLLLRTTGDPTSVIPAVMNVLRRAVPNIRSVDIESFDEALDPQVRPWRVGAMLFGLFGAVVVVVAAIGLFSVVSYLVTQRTHELGVRLALGARPGQLLRLVMENGLRTASAGAAAGGAVSLAIAPLLQPLLFDNDARDPALLAAVATGLMVVAAAAGLWPSWRATRVDPMLALRAE